MAYISARQSHITALAGSHAVPSGERASVHPGRYNGQAVRKLNNAGAATAGPRIREGARPPPQEVDLGSQDFSRMRVAVEARPDLLNVAQLERTLRNLDQAAPVRQMVR